MSAAVHEFSGYLPALHLAPGLAIPTYFVIISLDFCLCLLWLVRRAERFHLSRDIALDLSLALMIGGFFGARFFHVFFEEPGYYTNDPWRVLEVWRGGFVWYGGAVLGAASAILLARKKRLSLPAWLDLFAPIAAFGYGVGRVACVLEGCCYGAVCELASGARFRYPTQIFAVVWELALAWFLVKFEQRRRRKPAPAGQLFAIWLVLHAVGRVLMESFRADPRGPEPLGVSVSSWISFALLFAGAGWIFYSRRRPLNKI